MEIPIFRAVPSTIFIALLIFVVFKSGNLIFAISSNWAFVIEPTLILFGVDEPFLIFAAFCKEYNAKTNDKAGLIIPVEISVYEDRSYTFVLKTPPASVLLANAAKIKKGSSTPNKVSVGSITKVQLEEIANIKLPDLNTTKISSAMKIVEGTARNMGISIVD
jgi:large subunit ribosomal protein L11